MLTPIFSEVLVANGDEANFDGDLEVVQGAELFEQLANFLVVLFRLTNRQGVVEGEELRVADSVPSLCVANDGGDEVDEFGRVVHAAALTGSDRGVCAARLDLRGDVGRQKGRVRTDDVRAQSGDCAGRAVDSAQRRLLEGASVARFHRERGNDVATVRNANDEVSDG